MPQIHKYRATVARPDGKTSSMIVLALTITDAQKHVEQALTAQSEYASITVERERA